MSIYLKFCREHFDSEGWLDRLELCYPDNFNFGYDVVDSIAVPTPQKRALVWCNTKGKEHVFTFAAIRGQNNRMANVFRSAGLRRGNRVLAVLKRHHEYWFVAVVLHKPGCHTHPRHPHADRGRLCLPPAHFRRKGGLLHAADGVPARLRAAIAETDLPGFCRCMQREAEGFANLAEQARQADSAFARLSTSARSDASVFHLRHHGLSQGRTARFHLSPGTHCNGEILAAGRRGRAAFHRDENRLGQGQLGGARSMASAVMVFDFDNFDPRQLTVVTNRYGVTSFCSMSTVYRYLVRKGVSDIPSLRHVTTAGEMLAPEVFQSFTRRTGIPLREGYGQTETTLLMANFAPQEAMEGSCGTISPFYTIELRGHDGEIAADGEIGEVVIVSEKGGAPAGRVLRLSGQRRAVSIRLARQKRGLLIPRPL